MLTDETLDEPPRGVSVARIKLERRAVEIPARLVVLQMTAVDHALLNALAERAEVSREQIVALALRALVRAPGTVER